MRTILNMAIAVCLLSLVVVNLAANPFVPRANADGEIPCEGEPPGPNCGCCTDCGCWVCE